MCVHVYVLHKYIQIYTSNYEKCTVDDSDDFSFCLLSFFFSSSKYLKEKVYMYMMSIKKQNRYKKI